MSLLEKNRAATDADDDIVAGSRPRCSCLPFGFWRGSRSSRRTEDAPGKQQRRRRRRIRLRLSWLAFSWPWLPKSGKKKAGGDGTKAGKQRTGRRLLVLLKTSLQFKKALASVVVSGDSSGLLPAKVGSFGGDAKQSRSKPRPTADGTRQPQASTTTATATGTRGSTVPARPGTNQPCTTTTTTPDEPVLAGRIWRAPSRRHSLHQPDRADDVGRPAGAGGLWTAATTLGVIVLFGRVTAVFFLCSCLYGVRFVRARAAAASARTANSSGVAGGSISRRFSGPPIGGSSRRFGDPIAAAAAEKSSSTSTEGFKKKVVMAGLLERPGNRPSSRFGR